MNLNYHLQRIKSGLRINKFKIQHLNKMQFTCPICNYQGPFKDIQTQSAFRKHAKCPSCNSLERHRLQYLVIQSVLKGMNTGVMSMLHFAPEPWLRDRFLKRFGGYATADLYKTDVDCRVDLQDLPFASASIDFVFASHVLEHVPDDRKAISEIRRILKPDGIAILPVPIISERTIEYPEPNPFEHDHYRAPGLDYFDRYAVYFSKVDTHSSDMLPEYYQLYIYSDRSCYPTEHAPLRQPMVGERHIDYVPVCYV